MQKYPFITPASLPHPAVLIGFSCIRTLQIFDILSQIRSMCALLSSHPSTFVLMIMCCPQLHPTHLGLLLADSQEGHLLREHSLITLGPLSSQVSLLHLLTLLQR